MRRFRKAVAREIEIYLWPDPVSAILFAVAVALLITFGVLLICYQLRHGGHYPW